MSDQESEASMYEPIVRPRPPPRESLVACWPEIGVPIEVSARTRSSASRLPGTGASTVTHRAEMEVVLWMVDRSCSVAERDLLTYSWKKNGVAGEEAVIASTGNEAFVDI